VNRVQTVSIVCAPSWTTPRAPETPRNSVSMTLRTSRGANRSVGVTISVAPADELLADVDGERPAGDRGGEAANRRGRPQRSAIADIETGFHL
jgi:hypothetical protein